MCLLYTDRVEIQDLKLEESAQSIAELTERLKQYEEDLEAKENVSISKVRILVHLSSTTCTMCTYGSVYKYVHV